MKIAITGGTGFVGTHLAQRLAIEGHEVIALSRTPRPSSNTANITYVSADVSSIADLTAAFVDCDAVAHCAGINREINGQTYQRVHVEGTQNVVTAAQQNGVSKIVLMSFLRARPTCGSPYHESKWAAEEIIRSSDLDYTVIKAGMVYGLGDHMLDHLSRSLHTLPIFATVGCNEAPIRPLAIEDLVNVMCAAILDARLPYSTIALTGAEELLLSEAVRRVAQATEKSVFITPLPVWCHYALAHIFERIMTVPLVAWAQVRILAEGVTQATMPYELPPADLLPQQQFTVDQIRRGLPVASAFNLRDLRCFA